MDEAEFRQVLEQFPVVRDRNFVIPESSPVLRPAQSSGRSSAPSQQEKGESIQSGNESDSGTTNSREVESPNARAGTPEKHENDLKREANPEEFWKLLQESAEEKVGPEVATVFCSSFRKLHLKMVNEALSLDDIQRIAKAQGYQGLEFRTRHRN